MALADSWSKLANLALTMDMSSLSLHRSGLFPTLVLAELTMAQDDLGCPRLALDGFSWTWLALGPVHIAALTRLVTLCAIRIQWHEVSFNV